MRILVIGIALVALLYLLLCGLLYLKQEKLLFYPSLLPAAYQFNFPGQFEERWVTAADGQRLHGLLFKVPKAKGLVFYLHGNTGGLDSWGAEAPTYTALGYDVFMPDYRGYGKSGGCISSQAQLLDDVEAAYQSVLQQYDERKIVVLGYSLGSGLAAWLAARHYPRLLILQAPYYSMRDVAARLYPFIPGFLLRYPLPTNELIGRVKAPVVLFHGRRDEVIYYGSAVKLRKLLGANGQLIELPDAGHSGITQSPIYQHKLRELLGGATGAQLPARGANK